MGFGCLAEVVSAWKTLNPKRPGGHGVYTARTRVTRESGLQNPCVFSFPSFNKEEGGQTLESAPGIRRKRWTPYNIGSMYM